MLISNKKMKKAMTSMEILVVLIIFCVVVGGITISGKNSTDSDIKLMNEKADAVINSYSNKIKKDKYLTTSNKAKLINDLIKIGYNDVEITAPEKETNEKTINMNVVAKIKNQYGGIFLEDTFLKNIDLN